MNKDFLDFLKTENKLFFIGLGNIGDRYHETRHNAGFIFIDELISKYDIKISEEKDLFSKFGKHKDSKNEKYFAKPLTYMNDSGKAVQKIINYYKLDTSNLILIHDDLDIELGKYKIQFGKGPRVHNGVDSVEKYLGTPDFWRIRIGIENRTPELRNKISGKDFVLMKLKLEELRIIEEVILKIINIT